MHLTTPSHADRRRTTNLGVAVLSRRMYGVRTASVCTRYVPKRGHPMEPRARPAERSQRDSRLNLRTSSHQDDLIRRAASALDKSVTDFVLESATARAERVLADRRWFALDDERWARFQDLLDEPAPPMPRLRALLAEPTVFDAEGG